jgi:uncharacterized membrane protein
MRERLLKIVSYCSFLLVCSGIFCLNATAQNATAQNTATQNTTPAVRLYSPYTRISVPPGKTISYSVKVINNSSTIRNVPVSLLDLPRGWTYTLKSGSWDISRISVLPKSQQTLSLQVMVPLKVNKGSYVLKLRAAGFDVLPLTVVVSQKGTYKTAFSTKQSNLEGAATSNFTFNATLRNETADTSLYALHSEAPPGWNVTFKASYKQVASVKVNANNTQSITINVKAPDQVAAGTYKIPVFASTGRTSAALELEVVITGSYAMELTTPNGLLSTHITAGDEKRIQLVVENTGSAALKKISMSFTAPENWDVTFDPKTIDVLPAGKTAQVFATIKADKDAIAGDYDTNLEAKTAETSSKAVFRVSVRTPMLWGWIGILIILVALGSVYYLFRKYGRR